MRKARLVCAVVLAAITASTAFARGSLAKWKDWDTSPQGYFMTKAERADWANVKTDADAEKFIHDFLAKRPDTFAKDVADRAAQADKYLTIGKLPGSKTLRGKIVILLGPPQGLDVTNVAQATTHHENQAVSEAMTNMNSAGGSDSGRGGGGGNAETIGTSYTSASQQRMYHFTYSGDAAKKVDRKTVELTVQADPNTGKDRMANHADELEIDLLQEQIAQTSLKK